MIGACLVREQFRAMGTECEVAVTGTRRDLPQVRRALAAARREIESCERILSRFDERSDLSRLNRAQGAWVSVDPRLLELLRVALRMRDETRGRFDPTILPVLVAAGYDRSFERLEQRSPVEATGWRPRAVVEIDTVGSRARVEPGAGVDLGGIAKGFAASRALWAMNEAWLALPGGLADLGGDIAVWGATPEGGPWRVAVADPRRPGADIGTIELAHGAVATSGRDRRRFGPGGRLHHLIDPATGAPADAGPLAVTVVSTHAAEAEAHATALAVTAPAQAAGYLAARPRLAALLVPDEGAPFALGDLSLVVNPRISEATA